MTTRVGGVVWQPESLSDFVPDAKELARYLYVVLEEQVDDRVELLAWPWPLADRAGHLVWPDAGAHRPHVAAIEARSLREQIYRPNRIKRPPRLGDVYAAAALGDGWNSGGVLHDARHLFEGPLYDISADAREAAKLSYQGALAPVRAHRAADGEGAELLARAAKDRNRRSAKRLRVAGPPDHRSRP